MLHEESLKKFKMIYKEAFNKELTDDEALDKATKLLRLIELVYIPITKKDYEQILGKKDTYLSLYS